MDVLTTIVQSEVVRAECGMKLLGPDDDDDEDCYEGSDDDDKDGTLYHWQKCCHLHHCQQHHLHLCNTVCGSFVLLVASEIVSVETVLHKTQLSLEVVIFVAFGLC